MFLDVAKLANTKVWSVNAVQSQHFGQCPPVGRLKYGTFDFYFEIFHFFLGREILLG